MTCEARPWLVRSPGELVHACVMRTGERTVCGCTIDQLKWNWVKKWNLLTQVHTDVECVKCKKGLKQRGHLV